MKMAGWAGLFMASFLVGHFVANPWLYPVGKILLFIKIYISALVAFIILNQVIPYVWRTLSKWQMDYQQSTGMKEQNLSGGMRLSFAAAGLSSAMERGKKEASPQPEPMPRTMSALGDGAASTALTLLNATTTAVGKKDDCWKEADSPRKLFLLPPVKAEPEKNTEQFSVDKAESPRDSIGTCDAITEDIANKEATVAVEELTAVSFIEDSVETELIAACEIIPATVECIPADTQEMSAELVDGLEQAFIASATDAREAAAGPESIAPVEPDEEQELEELEFEGSASLVVESDIPVESIPTAGVVPLAFLCAESETLGQILAVDATGITAEIMDMPAENQMNEISFEAEYEDFAAEGMDLGFFTEVILQGGVTDGSFDQVAVAYEEVAEIIEIAETIEVGTNIMATEEFVGPCREEQDFLGRESVEHQYQDIELSREQTDEILAMDDSSESECECISMEETDESSGLDICETVELATIEPIMPISIEVASFEPSGEPSGCVDIQPIESATTEETLETVIVEDIIELRPVGAEISIHNIQKVEEKFIPMPHSYSCRLRCQKPGGIFQGPILSFYCRFICQHGNY